MIKKWKQFNENNDKELHHLLQIDNGSELKYFLYNCKYKNFEKKFDFDNLIVINNGAAGLVYTYSGESDYYKLTYDKNSYLLARKLVGKNFHHLVSIKDVDVINNNYRSLYIIRMEECAPLTELLFTVLEHLYEEIICYMSDIECNITDFSDDSNFDEYYTKEDVLDQLIKYLCEDDYIDSEDLKYLDEINLVGQLKEMKKELHTLGFNKLYLDIHHDNVMLKKDTNNLCLIDFLTPKNFINTSR